VLVPRIHLAPRRTLRPALHPPDGVSADGVVVSVEAWIFSLLGVWLLIVACTLIFLSGGDE